MKPTRLEVIALMALWWTVGALSAYLFGLWAFHPEQRPLPIRDVINECPSDKTQVLHTDGAEFSSFVIDRNIRCVTVIGRGQ